MTLEFKSCCAVSVSFGFLFVYKQLSIRVFYLDFLITAPAYNVTFCYSLQLTFPYLTIYVFEVGITKPKTVVTVVHCKAKPQKSDIYTIHLTSKGYAARSIGFLISFTDEIFV